MRAILRAVSWSELRPEELDHHDRDYEVIISIRATKEGGLDRIAAGMD
jgi:hypothetical protein